MSIDEQITGYARDIHDEHAPAGVPVATVEGQDEPAGVPIGSCPVCGCEDGTAYRKAHGAGTRIEHPRRAFPCSTSTVVPELDA